MKFWSSLICFVLIGETLGFPRPDVLYDIPTIPKGDRAQYYVLHDDGTFKYGYDTGNHQYEAAKKMDGLVSGYYGFVDPNGQNVKLYYTAGGEQGFVPQIITDDINPTVALTKKAQEPSSIQVIPSVKSSLESIPIQSDIKGASYSFSYDAGDHSRREEADDKLNVKGDYTFIADDGVRRRVDYVAGSKTGFVATADFLPKAPEVSVSSQSASEAIVPIVKSAAEHAPIDSDIRGASYSFSYDAGDHSRREKADDKLNVKGDYTFIADDGIRRRVDYVAGSKTGFVAAADFLPKAAVESVSSQSASVALVPVLKSAVEHAPIDSDIRGASYSFSYDAGDHSRREEADDKLNVKGDYTFIAGDGVRRRVDYVAGSKTGFVATADFLPKAPEEVVPVLKSAVGHSPIDSNIKGASYSFSYNAGDHSRREEADDKLNVRGDYTFIADDGVRRRVDYVAGSKTGFVATGDFLPKAPEGSEGSISSKSTSVDIGPVLKSAVEHSPIDSVIKGAGYSFSYDAGDHSRREDADNNLNVRGDYTFIADDGVRRKVDYVAGSKTGFVATADFIPKAPEVSVIQPKLYALPAQSNVRDFTYKSSHAKPDWVQKGDVSSNADLDGIKEVKINVPLHDEVDQPLLKKHSELTPSFLEHIVGNVHLKKYLGNTEKHGYVFVEV